MTTPPPSEHKHRSGKLAYLWTEDSHLFVDGKRYTAADCEDPECPFQVAADPPEPDDRQGGSDG